MDDYRVPTDEQETVIQFDRNGTVCHVYTTDLTVMTKLDKKYKRVKQDYVNRKPIAAYYEFDKRLLSFRSKVMKKNLSDEEKKKAREQLAKNRKMKGK
ncbi:hypothetical protein [Mitsuokella multacida]|uniref:hypothetical protein n=1 Tax=Mitsuokella multacida TaxID=52226 RepID=UPI0001B46B29|nr:hypothetical protein [Mitsuokella multacida]